MKGDILRSKILSEKIIPNMNEQYRKQFPIPEGHRSLGIFTADCDDVCYIGMDEASKSTDIQIVHATALYAGAANASFKLSGEFYGAFSAPNPEDIVSAFKIIHHVVENDAYFVDMALNDYPILYRSALDPESDQLIRHAYQKSRSILSFYNKMRFAFFSRSKALYYFIERRNRNLARYDNC